jgi:WD40 repeat protein
LAGCGGKDKDQTERIEIPDYTPPRVTLELAGHQGGITKLAFTPDGQFLISVSYSDYSLRVWDLSTGGEIASGRTPNRVRGMVVPPDGGNIYTADAYNNITRWPLEKGRLGEQEVLEKNGGDSLSLNPAHSLIAATGFQRPIRLWDLGRRQTIRAFGIKPDRRVLRFSPSGHVLVAGGTGNTYSVWDTEKWQEKNFSIRRVGKDSEITSIDISADGKYMATGHNDSSIVIFDFKKKEELHNFFVTDASTHEVKFSPDNRLLATAQQNHRVYLWQVKTAAQLAVLDRHGGAVTCLAFSPDGSLLATGGEDRNIFIWHMNPGQTRAEPEPQATPPSSAPTAGGNYQPQMTGVEGVPNLIGDANAGKPTPAWKSEGEAAFELEGEDNAIFAIRYGGVFRQEVKLEGSTGKFALLIAWASSERINDSGDRTGLPYLHGYMLHKDNPTQTTNNLQGQQMMWSAQVAGEWGLVYGIFEIPSETGSIRFFMQQADGKEPHDGSAARFDEPGIFIFNSKKEAERFVEDY